MQFDGSNIKLSPDKEDNYVQIEHEDFRLSSLNPTYEGNKGASSNLFRLVDPYGDVEDRAIKICKSPLSTNNGRRKIARFRREIRAFKIAARTPLDNVVQYYKSGEIEIKGETFLFIIMEMAEEDLATFLERNHFNFTTNQKLGLCVNILNGIRQLHDARIYHRDIKHDNILRVGKEFKIGDLGLVEFQDRDYDFDYIDEKIGPIGWLCPEATNKMLTGGKKMEFEYDCIIDRSSDIFQLGKLFWYIFQGNLPTGQVIVDDCNCKDNTLFELIFQMLQYQKARRPNMEQLQLALKPLMMRYGV